MLDVGYWMFHGTAAPSTYQRASGFNPRNGGFQPPTVSPARSAQLSPGGPRARAARALASAAVQRFVLGRWLGNHRSLFPPPRTAAHRLTFPVVMRGSDPLRSPRSVMQELRLLFTPSDKDSFAIRLEEAPGRAVGVPATLTPFLEENDYENLRWYLEEYMDLPDGGAVVRAQGVERQTRGMGPAAARRRLCRAGERHAAPATCSRRPSRAN